MPSAEPSFNWEPWLLGGLGLALLALLLFRLRGERSSAAIEEEDTDATAFASPAGPSPVRARGAWITVALRPVRAGLNMVTAVVDCEITVTNEGSATAEGIRAAVTLRAAHGTQPAEIEAVNAEPIGRSLVAAFALAPGESRTFRGVASANLDLLATMRASGREMLVPLVLLNVEHRDPAGVEYRTSQGFVVGVERVDSAKLAPFWLDSIRMIDQVAARPSGAPDRRRIEPSR